MNDLSPSPFSKRRGDYGSLRSRAFGGSALGRPGGRPMKLHATLAALLLAAASSLSFGVYAAAEADKAPAAKLQADTPAVTKIKPHSHMEEKTGMPQQKSSAAAPESDKAKDAKAKTDKDRHLHPRDGK
ncbi:MAG: hypothetical protein Q8O52_03885 [Sulfuritalea sp.]|nr:hypothetical protein [Sulfuritalea sp.]